MIQQKQKKCKGIGKAIGYGCGDSKYLHKFGLCQRCFKEWLFSNDGLPYLSSTQIRAKKYVQKKQRKEQQEKKESIRKKSWYEKNLESEVNEIIRLIDNDKGCISCKCGWETTTKRQFHAGHRKSVKSNPTIRYHMFNIFKQCSICNNWESANEREYDKGIIRHYGQEILDLNEQLASQYKELHLSIDELKQAIINARKVKKDILLGIDYTRIEINQRIGIYESTN